MNIPNFLEIIGVAGLGLLAISTCLMGLLNGNTPSKIKNQGFYCLGAFLTFASIIIWMSIFGLLSSRDSRIINLMSTFIFVFIMADIILDARSARKALKQ